MARLPRRVMRQIPDKGQLVEMNWDPITRIVGSLGIFTKIDFDKRKVAECHSTSSIFRGYSIFMKGKDPRDAHFITSRICGICGDNHATCATYAQNMAFGVQPPAMAEWIVNLGEAAEYMFDHNIFQDNLVGVDFCEQMVKETNPGVWEKAEKTAPPHAELHGYQTIADIMTAPESVHRLVLSRSAADEPDDARDVLPDGRPPRASFDALSGRRGHRAHVQLFTDYIVRLMKYVEFMKKVVPLHDDLFDFFYEALPGYEEVGRRRDSSRLLGLVQQSRRLRLHLREDDASGAARCIVTPGVVVDGELVTTDLVDINLNIRILLGSSYYDDWQNAETFVKKDPLGNPVDQRHPWNQSTLPEAAETRLHGKVHLGDVAALVRQAHRRLSRARHRRRPDRALLGDGAGRNRRHRLHQGDRPQRENLSAQDHVAARGRVRMEDSEVEQRDRARSRTHLLPGLRRRGGAVLRRTGAG